MPKIKKIVKINFNDFIDFLEVNNLKWSKVSRELKINYQTSMNWKRTDRMNSNTVEYIAKTYPQIWQYEIK
jgi:hypothetical protein